MIQLFRQNSDLYNMDQTESISESASLSLQTELNPQIIFVSKAANEIVKEVTHH